MAQIPSEVLANIRQYARRTRNAQQSQMELDESSDSKLEARLDQTIKELQMRVNEQRDQLEKLRTKSSNAVPQAPASDKNQRLAQLRVIKKAYEDLTPTEPSLPDPQSVLPTLLATRTIQQTIANSKSAIESTTEQADAAKKQLEYQEQELHDANAITAALEARIERLRNQQSQQSQKSPEQIADELRAAKQARKTGYEAEIRRLRASFNGFVESHLAAMLAVEELGGPVAGDLADINDDMLAAGFSNQGRPKVSRSLNNEARTDKRQQRLDNIWVQPVDSNNSTPRNEKDAAAAELHGLVEDLFNALLGSGGSGGYVQLERDSAAARFLVRAKVAQFHPKDARRLRLIDFGRELDDRP
ncbi:hypothetical protein LTS18_004748 [Coniosporium uncinatum]|uniref:Uncharacterized protein n=1 Tax=Coniosporium uncinatum TaxID=93489 RepID=A0ACC3D5E6_9PEZI|nr:hypothetical protein LTS18_004748 [Coniosporium uncinatum]